MTTATRTDAGIDTETSTHVQRYDWPAIAGHLDAYGWALLDQLVPCDECPGIVGLYEDERRFRSHIIMARHGFGRGEYKYFEYPLPETIETLRVLLYPR